MGRICLFSLLIMLTAPQAFADENATTETESSTDASSAQDAETEATDSDGSSASDTDTAPSKANEDASQTAKKPQTSRVNNEEQSKIEPTESPTITAVPMPPSKLTEAQWLKVYERADNTVKTGGYVAIGGGVMGVLGIVSIGRGLTNWTRSGESGDPGAEVVGGALLTGIGVGALYTAPAIMAGGSVRQNRAVRQFNPSAPGPGLGYVSWATWAIALTAPANTDNFPYLKLLFIPSYVLAAVQNSQNRLYWTPESSTHHKRDRNRARIHFVPTKFGDQRGVAAMGHF